MDVIEHVVYPDEHIHVPQATIDQAQFVLNLINQMIILWIFQRLAKRVLVYQGIVLYFPQKVRNVHLDALVEVWYYHASEVLRLDGYLNDSILELVPLLQVVANIMSY